MKKLSFSYLKTRFTLLRTTKALGAVFLVSTLVACDGIGSIASNAKVRDADNDRVVFIGDSLFALSGKAQDFLEDYAGETFRRYTISGASLEGGGFIAQSVTDQYAEANADDGGIDTIVMDGAGNDILIPVITAFDPYNCRKDWWEWRLSSRCKNFIQGLIPKGSNLLNTMNNDGVDDVIFMGYYYTKWGVLGPLHRLKAAIDYGDGKLSQLCSNASVNCEFVDTRSAINNSDIIFDGIHPNTGGSRKLADLIWPKLSTKL